jgi:hypothetical protein
VKRIGDFDHIEIGKNFTIPHKEELHDSSPDFAYSIAGRLRRTMTPMRGVLPEIHKRERLANA